MHSFTRHEAGPSTLRRVSLDAALAAAATLVATAFAAATLERWLVRRRPHELAWTVSLAMFAAASAALWVAEAAGWSSPSFRAFYLFGAILNVPWLALGTVFLLAGRRIGDGVRWGLVLASGFAAGVLVTAPLRAPVPTDELPEGQELFEPLPRILAAVGSGVAALVVIAGALWSAWRLARGRAIGSRTQAVTVKTAGRGERRHRAGHARPVGQRDARRAAREGHRVRGHARGRRRRPVLRLPHRHAGAAGPSPRLAHVLAAVLS